MDHVQVERSAMVLPPGSLTRAFSQPMVVNPADPVSTGRQPYYRPLEVVLVSSLRHACGPDPACFRAASFTLGALGLLCFAAFVSLCYRRIAPAVFAASLPAVHPAGIEVRVWISGLSEALVDLWVVLGVLLAWVALQARGRALRGAGAALSLLALALALASKENGAVLVALVLALVVSLAWAAPQRGVVLRRGLPLVGLHGALALVYFAALRPRVLGGSVPSADLLGGDVWTHLWSSWAVWARQMLFLVAPLRSSSSDVVRVVTSPADPEALLGLLLALGSLLGWLLLLRSGRPLAALGLAWIWIAYLPASNLVPLLHARADRYVFLSCFGLGLLGTDLGLAALRSLAPPLRRRLAFALAALCLAALAQRTWVRTPDWRSDEALFGTDLAADPHFREGRHFLAWWLVEAKREAEALGHLEILLEQQEGGIPGRSGFLMGVDVPFLYCRANLELRRYAALERFFQDARSRNPAALRRGPLRRCRAAFLETTGRTEDALELYAGLARERGEPDSALLLALARCHATLGRLEDARQWLGRLPPQVADDPALAAEARRIRQQTGLAP